MWRSSRHPILGKDCDSDPAEVGRHMVRAMDAVREFRRQRNDSYNFNWLLSIQPEFQRPFEVTHESMRSLELHRDQPLHELAANLRRAVSLALD